MTTEAKDCMVTLTDENGTAAMVMIPDLQQSSGVIHVIYTALLPKG